MRVALGVAVFSGMLGVTLFGIFFTPVFYVAIRWFTRRKAAAPDPDARKAPAAGPARVEGPHFDQHRFITSDQAQTPTEKV
jgi:hypothetical protein